MNPATTPAYPEALRLAVELECRTTSWPDKVFAAAELRRLHAENVRLAAMAEAQQPTPSAASKAVLAAIRAANMQLVRTGDDEFMLVPYKRATAEQQAAPKAAPVEPVNGWPVEAKIYKRRDEWVLELSGAINDCAFTCRHTQPGYLQPEDVAGLPSLYSEGIAPQPSPTPQADSQPAPVVDYPPLPEPDLGMPWRVNAKSDGAAHSSGFTCEQMRAYVDADRAARAPADSVLEDAARLERERICAAIKAEDDYCVDHGDYMLDSDDCIKIVRGEWVRPDFAVDAARKQGANHD